MEDIVHTTLPTITVGLQILAILMIIMGMIQVYDRGRLAAHIFSVVAFLTALIGFLITAFAFVRVGMDAFTSFGWPLLILSVLTPYLSILLYCSARRTPKRQKLET